MPSFFVPTPGDLTAQESPPPGICHPRQKKYMNCPGVSSGERRGAGVGWAQLELTDALSKDFFNDARKPEVDFLHTWVVILTKFSGKSTKSSWELERFSYDLEKWFQ